MKDSYKNEIEVGDTLIQLIDDGDLPQYSEWKVIAFGIEPSTMKNICTIKSVDKDYICSCYQVELKFFRKKILEMN